MFYLLWQKEIRELKGGIYNVLNTSKFRDTTVLALLNDVNNSDLVLESNLTTMFSSGAGPGPIRAWAQASTRNFNDIHYF